MEWADLMWRCVGNLAFWCVVCVGHTLTRLAFIQAKTAFGTSTFSSRCWHNHLWVRRKESLRDHRDALKKQSGTRGLCRLRTIKCVSLIPLPPIRYSKNAQPNREVKRRIFTFTDPTRKNNHEKMTTLIGRAKFKIQIQRTSKMQVFAIFV